MPLPSSVSKQCCLSFYSKDTVQRLIRRHKATLWEPLCKESESSLTAPSVSAFLRFCPAGYISCSTAFFQQPVTLGPEGSLIELRVVRRHLSHVSRVVKKRDARVPKFRGICRMCPVVQQRERERERDALQDQLFIQKNQDNNTARFGLAAKSSVQFFLKQESKRTVHFLLWLGRSSNNCCCLRGGNVFFFLWILIHELQKRTDCVYRP